MSRFRAVWPIHNNTTIPFTDLCTQAAQEIPVLALIAHARIIGPGRFTIMRASDVPGSGNTTTWCLLYDAPAEQRQHRTQQLQQTA